MHSTALNEEKGALTQTSFAARSASRQIKSRSTAKRESKAVALYSASVKPVSRSSGRSATAAAAYRNAERITDERTGEVHDYSRRSGVDFVESFAPVGMVPQASAELWNRAEAAEVRKNARVAREVLVALPHELDQVQRRELAKSIAQGVADRYGTAGTLAVHHPDREGDNRNHHVHILMTTRRLDASGQLGEKTRELDDVKQGPQEVEWIREMIEVRTNQALERAGSDARVDRRSLVEQRAAALDAGDTERAAQLDRPATIHEGPRVTQIRREAARAGRAPLGLLDRAAANDHSRQLLADRAELGAVSAQIIDFEKARALRDARARESEQATPKLTGSAAIRAFAAQLKGEQGTPTQVEPAHQVKPVTRPPSANQLELKALKDGLVPVEAQVAANPKVVEAKQELARHMASVVEANDWAVEIPKQAAEWRAQHPWRAALHDKGVKKSPELEYAKQSLDAVQTTLKSASQVQQVLEARLSGAERSASDMAHMERRPVTARIAELESAVRRELASDDAETGVAQAKPAKSHSGAVRRSQGPVRHGPERDEPERGMD